MAGTYRVDIHLLHDLNILNHSLQRYQITAIRIHLVTVCTFNKYGLSVHQELAVTYLNLAESNLLRYHLQHRSVRFSKSHIQCIQIGCLSSPFVRILNHKICACGTALDSHFALCNLTAGRILEIKQELFAVSTDQSCLVSQDGVLIIGVQIRNHGEIINS